MGRFVFDADTCTKCHACEVACAMWHGKRGAEGGFRTVTEMELGSFPYVRRIPKSAPQPGCDLCASCGGSPRCAATCPTGALVWVPNVR